MASSELLELQKLYSFKTLLHCKHIYITPIQNKTTWHQHFHNVINHAHFTNNISIVIQISWKFVFALMKSPVNFTATMFCTWQNAKFCRHPSINICMRAKWYFHFIWNIAAVGEGVSVKQAIDSFKAEHDLCVNSPPCTLRPKAHFNIKTFFQVWWFPLQRQDSRETILSL